VKSNLKFPVHALLCIAENSVGPSATRPDDVHTFYSGKTVEVNNTDAEGRLALGDGVAYAYSNLNPSIIVDMATLTGAQLIATGRRHAAIESNSDKLDLLAQEMGRYCGDLVHPIPYCPEFFRSEFASKVADMKNSVKDRSNAQSSCAGQFIADHIEDFINDGGEWLHIDMAGPVSSNERGTGYGVALLYSLVKSLSLR
jgi:probable aminopeptidase NPEPL1